MATRSVSVTSNGVTTTKIIPDRSAQAGVRTLNRTIGQEVAANPQDITAFTISNADHNHNGTYTKNQYGWERTTGDGSFRIFKSEGQWQYSSYQGANLIFTWGLSNDDTEYPWEPSTWFSAPMRNAIFGDFVGGSPFPSAPTEDVVVNRTAPVITSDRAGESRPLLSKVVGGAAAAYSLRDLNDKAGNNKVVNVRRDGDNDEKTFLAKEINKIVDFTNGQNGFVETLYDQSGNGIHASQPTTGLQPKIVDATTGLLTNGIDFNENKYLNFTSFPIDDFSVFAVIHYASLPTAMLSTIVGNDVNVMTVLSTSFNNLIFFKGIALSELIPQQSALPINQNFYVGFNRVNNVVTGYVNGLATSSVADMGVTTLSSISSAGFVPFKGSLSELIIYTADQSANRPAIEANINNQYSLY